MSQKQQVAVFPIEWGVMSGCVLAWSGALPAAILAIIAWFVLRHFRPATPSTILLVTAIITAESLLGVVATFFGYGSVGFVVEVVAVLAVSLLLFLTHAKQWAYVLVIHSGYVIVMRSIAIHQGRLEIEPGFERIEIGAIAVRVLIAWLLVSFIRAESQPVCVETSDASTNDDTNA
jgi:hypothetical protein